MTITKQKSCKLSAPADKTPGDDIPLYHSTVSTPPGLHSTVLRTTTWRLFWCCSSSPWPTKVGSRRFVQKLSGRGLTSSTSHISASFRPNCLYICTTFLFQPACIPSPFIQLSFPHNHRLDLNLHLLHRPLYTLGPLLQTSHEQVHPPANGITCTTKTEPCVRTNSCHHEERTPNHQLA